MNKIAIIGTGVYGIAMAIALSQNKDNEIIMWTESEENVKKLETGKKGFDPLQNIKIPKGIKFTSSYEEALKGTKYVYIKEENYHQVEPLPFTKEQISKSKIILKKFDDYEKKNLK